MIINFDITNKILYWHILVFLWVKLHHLTCLSFCNVLRHFTRFLSLKFLISWFVNYFLWPCFPRHLTRYISVPIKFFHFKRQLFLIFLCSLLLICFWLHFLLFFTFFSLLLRKRLFVEPKLNFFLSIIKIFKETKVFSLIIISFPVVSIKNLIFYYIFNS